MVKKESSHHITTGPTVSPEGTQEENKGCLPSSSHETSATPLLYEKALLAPESWGAHQRIISVNPDSCILPYTEKH